MLDIFSSFRIILEASKEKMRCFAKYEFQSEGWLKGEFIAFLNTQIETGKILRLEREKRMNMGGKKVDLVITFGDDDVWIELKHWHIGSQKGDKWLPYRYFRDKRYGPINDVQKLVDASKDKAYLVILNTPNPGVDLWERGLFGFNEKFIPFKLLKINEPSTYPDYFFLGLVKVEYSQQS